MRRPIGDHITWLCEIAAKPMPIGDIAFFLGMSDKMKYVRNLAKKAVNRGFVESSGEYQARLYKSAPDWKLRIQAANATPQKKKTPKRSTNRPHVPTSIFQLGNFL